MLSFAAPAVYQSSKCYFTYGTMGHVDPEQPPSKGRPWTAFAGMDFTHKVRAARFMSFETSHPTN